MSGTTSTIPATPDRVNARQVRESGYVACGDDMARGGWDEKNPAGVDRRAVQVLGCCTAGAGCHFPNGNMLRQQI